MTTPCHDTLEIITSQVLSYCSMQYLVHIARPSYSTVNLFGTQLSKRALSSRVPGLVLYLKIKSHTENKKKNPILQVQP